MTLKKKQKILKKVREHRSQIKKVEKLRKNTAKNNTSVAIPNKAPFKAELLERFDEQKDLMDSKAMMKPMEDAEGHLERQKLRDMLEYNDVRQGKFTHNKKDYNVTGSGFEPIKTDTEKNYLNHLNEIVTKSDIIIQTLDARNPQATRCKQFEEMIASQENKKLVFLLNKADLVPKSSLIEWLAYLKTQQETTVFQCAKSKPFDHSKAKKTKAKFNKSKALLLDRTVQACYHSLAQLLESICVKQDYIYRVCVVGLPHSGKKSVINTIKLVSPKVSSQKFSQNYQEINLSSNTRLLDTVGLIYVNEESKINSLARNSLKSHNAKNQVECCKIIADLCGLDTLRRHYCLQEFANYDEFLVTLTVKNGNSSSNIKPAMELVLKDWCQGKIKYYTPLPEQLKVQNAENSVGKSENYALRMLKSNVSDQIATKLEFIEPIESMY